MFLTEILVVARIQGFQEPVLGRAGAAGGVTRAETGSCLPSVEESSSRDPVTMEKEVFPTGWRHDTEGSAANRVRTLYIYVINPRVL
jgi:hypothetical protein